jgi:proline iminopeptidase
MKYYSRQRIGILMHAKIMSALYPAIEPYQHGYLAVDGRHQLYWEESGNPKGMPVLFLHGGPGAGSSPVHRRFFDPEFYRIIIFDQRGAGRSRPYADVIDNDVPYLVEDMEKLRLKLGVNTWVLFGGSWGSTLALCYAQTYPERVKAMILRGIYLNQRYEIDWFLYGIRQIFPEAWRQFAAHIPQDEQSNLLEAYYRRLIDPNPAIHLPAARQWSSYEGLCSALYPPASGGGLWPEDHQALAQARIEAHYFKHNCFDPETKILANIGLIRHIPATIIQGRYDIICPIRTADSLHHAWPEARYEIIADAGHSSLEPGISQALVAATNRLRAASLL